MRAEQDALIDSIAAIRPFRGTRSASSSLGDRQRYPQTARGTFPGTGQRIGVGQPCGRLRFTQDM
jgi:hypothetical protein